MSSITGIGLPKVKRARLLEPYVTTREKGTGLGLAMSAVFWEEPWRPDRITMQRTFGRARGWADEIAVCVIGHAAKSKSGSRRRNKSDGRLNRRARRRDIVKSRSKRTQAADQTGVTMAMTF